MIVCESCQSFNVATVAGPKGELRCTCRDCGDVWEEEDDE